VRRHLVAPACWRLPSASPMLSSKICVSSQRLDRKLRPTALVASLLGLLFQVSRHCAAPPTIPALNAIQLVSRHGTWSDDAPLLDILSCLPELSNRLDGMTSNLSAVLALRKRRMKLPFSVSNLVLPTFHGAWSDAAPLLDSVV
jgi:hypothetical protein